MLNRLLAVVVLLILVVLSCTKPPDYPDEPVIEFVGMDRNTMVQDPLGLEFIRMTISFTDGNGDLGSPTNDTSHVFVVDNRFDPPREQTIAIPLVPELGTGNGISGEATFIVYSSCCIYPGVPFSDCTPLEGFPTDTIIYDIYIYDRSGNKSNVIQSEPVILLCD